MKLELVSLLLSAMALSVTLDLTSGFSLRMYPAFRDINPATQRTPMVAPRLIPPTISQIVPQAESQLYFREDIPPQDIPRVTEAQLANQAFARAGSGVFFPEPSGMIAINPAGRMNYASLTRNAVLEPTESFKSIALQRIPIASNPGPLLNCSTYLECKAQLLTYLDLMSKMHKKG